MRPLAICGTCGSEHLTFNHVAKTFKCIPCNSVEMNDASYRAFIAEVKAMRRDIDRNQCNPANMCRYLYLGQREYQAMRLRHMFSEGEEVYDGLTVLVVGNERHIGLGH